MVILARNPLKILQNIKVHSRAQMTSEDNTSNYIWLLSISFLYAIISMAAAREIIIPSIFPLALDGDMPGDPVYYKNIAMEAAAKIRAYGITAFDSHPKGQGIAGVASLAYLTTKHTYGIIVLNAVMHSFSALLLALIARQWFSQITAIVCTMPMIASPYMMLWFSQINKESFALNGVLAITLGVLRILQKSSLASLKSNAASLLLILIGSFFVWLVRPYVNQLIFYVVAAIFLMAIAWRLRSLCISKLVQIIQFAFLGAIAASMLAILSTGAASDATIENFFEFEKPKNSENIDVSTLTNTCLQKVSSSKWKNLDFLPNHVNDRLKALMGQRCLIFSILETHKDSTTLRSIVDQDRLPAGSLEALLYLPRAAILGIFSPLPTYWSYAIIDEGSFFYAITSVEAVIFYIGIVSLLLWIVRTRNFSALVPVAISIFVMTLYGMAIPFVGALYRYRYPWWILLLCLGIAALFSLLTRDETHAKQSLNHPK